MMRPEDITRQVVSPEWGEVVVEFKTPEHYERARNEFAKDKYKGRYPTLSFDDESHTMRIENGAVTCIAHYQVELHDTEIGRKSAITIHGTHIATINGESLKREELERALVLG